jgi:alanine racemase
MNKWVEIDAEKMKHNIRAVLELVPPEIMVLAVVKNNAYGHGAVGMAQLLERQGVSYLGVSYLEEAMELRQAGIDADILIFAPLSSADEVRTAFENKLTVTVASPYDHDLVQAASAMLNFRLRIHVKLDTGLSRFGLDPEQLVSICQSLGANERLHLEGIYTHMAEAGNAAFTRGQFDRFTAAIERCGQEGIRFILRHCAGSEVFLRYPQMHLDMVRLGTLLTGQYPAGFHPEKGAPKLEDPFAFKTRVIAAGMRSAGAYLGYQRTYRLRRAANIAVIPVGYADGVALAVDNPPTGLRDLVKKLVKLVLTFAGVRRFNRQVILHQRPVPVRGKVFMQMTLLELPPGMEVQPGDEVTVPVRKTLVGKEVVRLTIRAGEPGKRGNYYWPEQTKFTSVSTDPVRG